MKSSLLIKDWSLADQPREKLVEKGPSTLTDAELIAILLGTGTRSGNALDLARQILQLVNNDLNALGRLAWSDITKIHGVGKAKAITIKAAMELGRRRKDLVPREISKITSSRDAYLQFQSELADLPNEEFWAIFLNRASKVLRKKRISEGGVSGTVADPKIIFKMALDELASSIIVAHNHPSGSLNPSQADIELTRKLVSAGKLLDIQVIDHIIVAGRNYCSFADSGLL
jgi:DNA repair protein RadC